MGTRAKLNTLCGKASVKDNHSSAMNMLNIPLHSTHTREMPNSFKQFIQATLPQRTPMSNTLFAGKSGPILTPAVCRCRQINKRTGDKIRKHHTMPSLCHAQQTHGFFGYKNESTGRIHTQAHIHTNRHRFMIVRSHDMPLRIQRAKNGSPNTSPGAERKL